MTSTETYSKNHHSTHSKLRLQSLTLTPLARSTFTISAQTILKIISFFNQSFSYSPLHWRLHPRHQHQELQLDNYLWISIHTRIQIATALATIHLKIINSPSHWVHPQHQRSYPKPEPQPTHANCTASPVSQLETQLTFSKLRQKKPTSFQNYQSLVQPFGCSFALSYSQRFNIHSFS